MEHSKEGGVPLLSDAIGFDNVTRQALWAMEECFKGALSLGKSSDASTVIEGLKEEVKELRSELKLWRQRPKS